MKKAVENNRGIKVTMETGNAETVGAQGFEGVSVVFAFLVTGAGKFFL